MKTSIDNITLITTFFKGKNSLLANRELRIEKALDEIHLLTTQGILLAKGRFAAHLPNIVIRINSEYWELINQLALEASFIPLDINQKRLNQATFAQYDYHSVPAGYQIHCQEAGVFWKTWWLNHRRLQLMDMLLLCNKRWYPVNHMQCDTGTIYVKTWREEQVLSITDTIVWLDRNTQEQRQRIAVRKHHTSEQPLTTRTPTSQANSPTRSEHPLVPVALRQVVKAGKSKLLVLTALGPVLIEGQNLTCTLARKGPQAS